MKDLELTGKFFECITDSNYGHFKTAFTKGKTYELKMNGSIAVLEADNKVQYIFIEKEERLAAMDLSFEFAPMFIGVNKKGA